MQLKEKVFTTQKAALFFTAGEVSRRGFNVSLVDDSILYCQDGENSFYIKVSGQKFKKSWIVEIEKSYSPVFYVFVYIPKDVYIQPEFFILNEKELKKEIKHRKLHSPKELLGNTTSLSFSTIVKYADKWHSLTGKE
jgi:hypothetical protein